MEHCRFYLTELPADAVAIPEYPRYFATPSGAIYSKCWNIRLKKTSLNRCGYPIIIMVHESGETRTSILHRIIAKLFVPGDHSLTVNHKDMVKTNCAASNLEWVTLSDNHKHLHSNRPDLAIATGIRASKALIASNPESREEFTFKSGKEAAIWVGNANASGNISKATVHGRLAYGFYWRKA